MAKSNFDLNKTPKRRFDLSKDVDDDEKPAAPVPPSAPQPESEPEPAPSKSRTGLWIAIIAAIAVVGALLWFCNRQSGEEPQPQPADTTVTAVDTIAAVDTATAPDQEPQPEATPAETPAAAPAEAPASAAPSAASAAVSDDIEAEARNVIRGNYGVGMERKQLLGDRYAAIQARVNQLMAAN